MRESKPGCRLEKMRWRMREREIENGVQKKGWSIR